MREYRSTAVSIGELVEEKNAAYGSSFERSGEIVSILYPNGISSAQMTDALCVVRVIDKLFRIATRKDAFGESPWKDIAGYGILLATLDAEVGDGPTESDPSIEDQVFVDANTNELIGWEEITHVRLSPANGVREVSASPFSSESRSQSNAQSTTVWHTDDGRCESDSYFANGEISLSQPPISAYEDVDPSGSNGLRERADLLGLD